VRDEIFHPPPTKAEPEAQQPLIAAPRRTDSSPQRICITFDMNRLQCIPSSLGRVLVTMNPVRQPHPSTVQGAYVYQHPLFTSESVTAWSNLSAINGAHGVSFAGAWMGYGFHEDGFVAGMQAAHNVLTSFKLPSSVQSATAWSNRYTRPLPALEWQHEACKILIGIVQAVIEAVGQC
jgi:predicted NAD/FAD-binding protein